MAESVKPEENLQFEDNILINHLKNTLDEAQRAKGPITKISERKGTLRSSMKRKTQDFGLRNRQSSIGSKRGSDSNSPSQMSRGRYKNRIAFQKDADEYKSDKDLERFTSNKTKRSSSALR